jgi:hypothetical protein
VPLTEQLVDAAAEPLIWDPAFRQQLIDGLVEVWGGWGGVGGWGWVGGCCGGLRVGCSSETGPMPRQWPFPENGRHQPPTPPAQSPSPQVGDAVQDAFGGAPQDVEGVWTDGRFAVVQARPQVIT